MGRKIVWVLLAATAAVMGCGDDDGTPDAAGQDAAPDGYTGTPMGVVEGKLFHALTLEPLPNATIKVLTEEGEQVVTTDAVGKFETNAPVTEQAVLKSEAVGQEATLKTALVHEGEASYVELFSMPVGKHQVIDPTEDATIHGSHGATLKLWGGSLVYADGSPVTDPVDVTLTPIAPQDPKQLAARPGRARGWRGGDSPVRLRPWVSTAVTLRQGGVEVNLGEGHEAELKMPVADPAAPKTMALWSLNEATGDWVEDGAVTKVNTQAGAVYKAQVNHFSYWSAEAPMDEGACLQGCVSGATGAARVVASGVDEVFREEVTTDREGCFAVDVPGAGRVRVQVAGRNGATARQVVEVTEVGGSADDPTSCQGVEGLVVETAEDESCPRGTVECQGRCVDLDSDVAHCGACNVNCVTDAELGLDAEGPIDGVACVAGDCGCPPSRPEAVVIEDEQRVECIDPVSDSRYCGEDRVDCAFEEECVDGQCHTLACPEGTEPCEVCDDDQRCRQQCVDTFSDARHCGGCFAGGDGEGDDCSGSFEGAACIDGECGCPTGLELCEIPDVFFGCVDTSTSMSHCGGCGQMCNGEMPDTAVCIDGQCTCREGLTDCEPDVEDLAMCMNIHWGDGFCGDCETFCDVGVCIDGECGEPDEECPELETYCMGECVQTFSDPQHCGGCGRACGENETCIEGWCTCETALEHIAECGDGESCTDLSSDPAHCGRCDRACGAGQRCVAGACVW